MKTIARLVGLAAACVLLLGSCGGGSQAPLHEHLRGFVVADDPVVGATIRVVDENNVDVPLTAAARTYSTGAFTARTVGAPPASFTIVATGGTWRGKPLTGELRRTVRGDDPRSVLYVTPVSTLVAAVAARKNQQPQPAEDMVESYLGLPSHHSLRDFKRHTSVGFSAAAFMTQAAAGAGLNAFVAQLADEVGTGKTRSFAPALAAAPMREPMQPKVDATTAVTVLQWVAVEISKAAGANEFTALLTSVGPAQVPAELAQVQQQLDQISAQISTLDTLIQTMGSDLACEVGQYGYEGSVTGFVPLLSQLKDTAKNMDVLASLETTDPSYAAQKAYVMTSMSQMISIHDTVHSVAVGSSDLDTSGAIRNLSKKLVGCGKFINAQKSQSIASQFQYWVATQASACQLVISYRKALGLAQASIDDAVNSCAGYVADLASDPLQITAAIAATDTNTVVDSRTDLMYRVTYQVAATVDDIGPYLDISAPVNANPGWFVPSQADIADFLTPFANASDSVTRLALARAGWSTYNATTSTYTDLYGPGDMFFWTMGPGDPRMAVQFFDPPFTMRWSGVTGEVTCACSAMVMLVRPTNTGERYYVK